MRRSVPSHAAGIDYPCSDGRPVAESAIHLECLKYVLDALGSHYERRGRGDVCVAANMFLYYEQGNPRAVVAPDVFVVFGAPGHRRDSYLLWNEPKAPDFVLEVTSKSTRGEDEGHKRRLYAALGVQEYFLFDPRGEYLSPPLEGYRLHGSRYRALPAVAVLPGGAPSVHSAVLGLDLRDSRETQMLRLHDPATGQDLLTYREEAAARRAAEARIAELEARLRDFGDPSASP